jgi:hypoxanthine phosphoribosyltransferase
MPSHDPADIEEILVDQSELARRIAELGATITADYEGRDLHLVTILKGSLPFLADLMRAIDLPVTVDMMGIASYNGTQSSGETRVTKDLDHPIAGRHVLVVEDIIDTGITLGYVLRNLRQRSPASVRVVTLLDKPDRRGSSVEAEYVGFTVPDRFVIGYGLDWNQRYRNLPYIAVLKSDVYDGPS